jgi:hypothetical protein
MGGTERSKAMSLHSPNGTLWLAVISCYSTMPQLGRQFGSATRSYSGWEGFNER